MQTETMDGDRQQNRIPANLGIMRQDEEWLYQHRSAADYTYHHDQDW